MRVFVAGGTGVVGRRLVPQLVAAGRPDAIVHQMTALSQAHAGRPNLRKPDRFFARGGFRRGWPGCWLAR